MNSHPRITRYKAMAEVAGAVKRAAAAGHVGDPAILLLAALQCGDAPARGAVGAG